MSGAITLRERQKAFLCLEGIRGVAAILIVFRHMPGLGFPDFPMSYLAVDLFFLLSGAVIANAYEGKLVQGLVSQSRFMLFRLVRIYPLYAAGSLIGLACVSVYGAQSALRIAVLAGAAGFMLPSVLPGFPAFPLDRPAWSLLFELVGNWLYARFIVGRDNRIFVIVMGSSLAMLAIGAALCPQGFDIGYQRRFLIFGVPRVLFSFLFGVLLFRNFSAGKRHQIVDTRHMSLLVLIVVGALLMAPMHRFSTAFIFGLVCIAIIFPAIVFCSLRLKCVGNTATCMIVLGECSYPIYVLHTPIYMALAKLSHGAPELYSPYRWEILAGLLIVSYATNHWADKPVRRTLNGKIKNIFDRPT